jgi:gamma-glutamyltranspeptidase / glutathione hydrolase
MVCSVDHLASSAGLAILRDGGTAADAAIAANAVLAVTTQHMCGMGGDLFALVHHADGAPPTCLNASGRAGSGADAAALRREGHTRMPTVGDVRAVTVPGCVDGWLALHARHGRLPLADVLEPARWYATNGFPASPLLAAMVPAIVGIDGADDYLREHVRPGFVVRRPGVARTLEAIVDAGRTGFYEGEFGQGLCRISGGLFTEDDLARVHADWVEPAGVRAWGHQLWTAPPNSQGFLLLAAARMAELVGFGAGRPDPDDAACAHALIEASRLAGHDRDGLLHEQADVGELLSDAELRQRSARFDPARRCDIEDPKPSDGDTTYLCVADAGGMAVSLIQSNANGWGVGITVPEVGVFLHNRGLGFSLEPGHPAEYAPGRRPPHTLAPALVQRPDGSVRAVLGTMGGDAQPHVVLQILARLLVAEQSPWEAVAAPRWRLGVGGFETWTGGGPSGIALESTTPPRVISGLEALGHAVTVDAYGDLRFGHAHAIERRPDGMLAGSHDPRVLTGGTACW